MGTDLSISHIRQLFCFDDNNKIKYYANQVEKRNFSKRQLEDIIKSHEYERLPESTKNKLIKQGESNIIDFVKNPIMIRNTQNYEIISEKILKKLILENIEFFMKELGNSFCFIGSEYKIKLDKTFNYIDLLLFNIEYNCYVVIELKITELKKEYIGQIQVYMNYIDKNLKKINQDKTIEIIICKQDKVYLTKRHHIKKQRICFI